MLSENHNALRKDLAQSLGQYLIYEKNRIEIIWNGESSYKDRNKEILNKIHDRRNPLKKNKNQTNHFDDLFKLD